MPQNLPIFPTDYQRRVSKTPIIPLVNRFVEQNPVLTDAPVSFIARPGLRKFTEVGPGPIRKVFSSAGAFNDDLFVVSGTELHRIKASDGTSNLIGVIGTSPIGDVSMAATSPIGTEVPSYLFIAEGGVLWYYTDNGFARAHLEITGSIANNDTIQLNGVYYRFTTGNVNAGAPAGTASNPWLVKLETLTADSLTNLFAAINKEGSPGTQYSTALVAHPTVEAVARTATDLYVYAKTPGPVGNGYASTETGAGMSFSNGSTFTGGGAEQLGQVTVPDDAGAISLTYINSYVIVVPVQSDELGTTGKFYWIQPGEKRIHPLDFANAERSPDKINQVITYGDMFWLFGDTTTEPWVTTGSPQAPMQRFQGILFDRGAWEGTAVKVRDSMIVVDEEGGVFIINNGQRRISNPAIEERIRRAIGKQAQ